MNNLCFLQLHNTKHHLCALQQQILRSVEHTYEKHGFFVQQRKKDTTKNGTSPFEIVKATSIWVLIASQKTRLHTTLDFNVTARLLQEV